MSEQDQNQLIEPTAFSRAEADSKQPLIRVNPVTALIAVLFAILLLAAYFMFSAKAVRFNFTPEVSALNISGSIPTYQLGERYLMLAGDYHISATLEGYETLSTDISVGDDAEQDFMFEMVKLPGIVEVQAIYNDTSVEGATVFIDQQERGKTPLTLDPVAAGIRDLYLTHPRFLPYQTEIDVIGLRQEQTESALLSPAWADVTVSSLPVGASIMVDGEVIGETPATVEVLQGTHSLKLRKKGYKSWETELAIEPQVAREIPEVLLVKSDGKLSIASVPPGANITIAGEYRGQTPLAVALPPARAYEIVATRAGYERLVRRFSIEADEDQSFNLVMKPVTGQVRISTLPAGGTLYIDDEESGSPNQTLNLTARNHTIRISQEGFADYVTDIIPQPGYPQQINVIMQTPEEARAAAIPERLTTALGEVLRFVVPGQFEMGAGRREPGRRSNEVQKSVELTRPFYIGETEITNKSFATFDPSHDSGILGRALLSEDDRPVVNVSWDRAIEFCNWLSAQDNLPAAYEFTEGRWQLKKPLTTGYRLPSEAEWAWVSRYAEGQPTRFPWGDNMPPTEGAGNFADEAAANMVPYRILGYNDSFRGPAPPGVFDPNALGIYDLAGNVSEWIHDYYAVELTRKALLDPLGPDNGEYHVIRGSNYTHGRFSELRWTFRDYGGNGRPDVGFRIARYLE